MIGAIAGDIIGSVYEASPHKSTDFPLFSAQSRFTDDTVLTLAVAQAILEDRPYVDCVKALGRRYPDAGYGGNFIQWLLSAETRPYNSWGNGSAMRVSPVGFAFDTEEDVLDEAKRAAAITHDHPEGIKGAQATALAIWMARAGRAAEIRDEIAARFDYDLDRHVDDIRPHYGFDVSCQGSVPEAIICALEAESCEDAIRKAVSLGGDADTQACIAGGIAEARFGLPETIAGEVRQRLPDELLAILDAFEHRFSRR